MLVDDLLSHVRTEVLRDQQQPYLFSDDALVRYLNEGLKQLARKTHFFTDEFDLYTFAGEKAYEVPEGTIAVTQVFMPERKYYLLQYNRRMKLRVWSGCPSAYSTDAAQQRIVLHPIPDQVYHLVVSRAYVPDAVDAGDDIPLPEEYAMAISDWMAYRALRNNDADGSNVLNADLFMRSWYEALRDLKRETIRFLAGDDPSAQPRRWS